ncbi:MAG TPA: hypothetical protein VF791_04950 [Pyrinomonadaceae bacterium]
MKTFSTTLKVLTCAIFIMALSSIAQAQATRTWVSGVGDDVNPCSRTAPCKTFAGAISKTLAGGEIDALDPGGFGTLTISKSITVDGTNGQGFGSTLNNGNINGFVINDSQSPTPNTSTVRLRNLSINGAGTTAGLNGIRFIAGKALHVENVTIDNQSSDGIVVATTAASIVHEVYMTNVTIRNAASDCIELSSVGAGSLVLASIDGVSLSNSGNGLRAGANSRVHIRDAQVATMNAGGFGVSADTASAEVNVDNCMITNNPDGVKTNGGTARVSRSVISGNTNGLNNVSGTLKRFNNNMIDGNTNNTAGTITPINQG